MNEGKLSNIKISYENNKAMLRYSCLELSKLPLYQVAFASSIWKFFAVYAQIDFPRIVLFKFCKNSATLEIDAQESEYFLFAVYSWYYLSSINLPLPDRYLVSQEASCRSIARYHILNFQYQLNDGI